MSVEMEFTTAAVPIVIDFLSKYLKMQFGPAVSRLQKSEEASEVLVGFAPSPSEIVQVSQASGATAQQKAFHQVQSRVDHLALQVLGKVQPAKSEVNSAGSHKNYRSWARTRSIPLGSPTS